MNGNYWGVLKSGIGDVPWENLFRWVVSSFLFTFVFFFMAAVPLAVLASEGDLASTHPAIQPGAIILGAIAAAIVVWSEDIPWPGDR